MNTVKAYTVYHKKSNNKRRLSVVWVNSLQVKTCELILINAVIMNQVKLNFDVTIPSNDILILLVRCSSSLLTAVLNVWETFPRLKITNFEICI